MKQFINIWTFMIIDAPVNDFMFCKAALRGCKTLNTNQAVKSSL